MYRQHGGQTKITKRDIPKLESALDEQEAKNAEANPKLMKGTGLPDRRRFNGVNRRKKPKAKCGRKRQVKQPPTQEQIQAKLAAGKKLHGHDLITVSADKLTDELKNKFITFVLQGATMETAAWLCEIHPLTVRSWMAKALDPTEENPKYSGFLQAVKKAEAVYSHQVELWAISPDGRPSPNGPQFESPRDAMEYMRLIGHPRVARANGVTVDKDTGELKAPTAGNKTTLSEETEITLEELKAIRAAGVAAVESAIAAGGVKGPAPQLDKPVLGIPFEK